jgi:ssDNA-specific exonuclease RecJ
MEPLWIKFMKKVLFFLHYVDISGGYIKLTKFWDFQSSNTSKIKYHIVLQF